MTTTVFSDESDVSDDDDVCLNDQRRITPDMKLVAPT
jgi:hypothetical protein